MNVSGQIFQIQNFSLHDGHGIRTVIFFSGCPLRCRWCANPEGMTREPSLAFYKNLCAGCGCCTAVCPDHRGIDWENPDIRKTAYPDTRQIKAEIFRNVTAQQSRIVKDA